MSDVMRDVFVHPTAVVDEGAELGEGVKVWHFGHVMGGAKIGEGTSLGQGCFVASGATVGARVKVQNHVSIYAGVEIEDDVFIGPSAVFTNVENPRAFVDRKAEFLPTRVRRGATIGANAVVVCGHVIGEYAFVGAGAVVTHDVPAHALVVGNPARRIGWVSRRGHRLADEERATCPESGETYEIREDGCVLVEAAVRASDRGASAQRVPSEGVDARLSSSAIPFVDLPALHRPLERELEEAFRRVLRSGKYVLGDEVARFEEAFAASLGVRHAIGVSSGSDALVVALLALGVGAGDEVLTSPFSFFATAEAIVRVGARPVFVDIEERGFHMDPDLIERAVTPRSRAVLPVHLFGSTFDPRLVDVARAHRLSVVEDAAQAYGARSQRGLAGTLGDLGCFSFFPTKNLGALGDGGIVVTDDGALAKLARSIRAHGAGAKYEHLRIGGNYRLDAIQAAFLSVKLPHTSRWTARRRAIADRYSALLAAPASRAERAIALPTIDDGSTALSYVIRTPRRDALRDRLTSAGISTEIYYPSPLHAQAALASSRAPADLPRAEQATREVLALPVHPGLSDSDVDRVASVIVDWLAGN